MDAVKPIDTIALFPKLHGHLISLLRGLSVEDWQRPTICKGWSVKDITAHLADVDLRMITLYRDDYQSLVNYLNKLNNDWVNAARRLSPAILIDWLQETGPQVYNLFEKLPP